MFLLHKNQAYYYYYYHRGRYAKKIGWANPPKQRVEQLQKWLAARRFELKRRAANHFCNCTPVSFFNE